MTLSKQNEQILSFKNEKLLEKSSLWCICYFTHLRANLNLFLTHCQFPCQMFLVINILAYLKNFSIQLLPYSSQQYFMWLITGINDHFLKKDLAIIFEFWLSSQHATRLNLDVRQLHVFFIKFHRKQTGSLIIKTYSDILNSYLSCIQTTWTTF